MTDEEKRLIINTPITMQCFENSKCTSLDLYNHTYDLLHGFIMNLEELREEYLKTKNEECLNEIIRLLPNSYKVVKL